MRIKLDYTIDYDGFTAFRTNSLILNCQNIFSSFSGHSFTVRLDASYSPKPIPFGLPQGTVLLTTHFAIYISDIPHPPNIQLAQYDDCHSHAILANRHHCPMTYSCHDHAAQILHQMETLCEYQENRGNIIYQSSSHCPNPTPVSAHHYPLEPTDQTPRPRYAPLYTRPPVLSLNSSPFLPMTQPYPHTTNSSCTNY
jgi:hypothetical protein